MKKGTKLAGLIVLLLVSLIVTSGCGNAKAKEDSKELTISAAASLKDALGEIEKDYKKDHPDIDLNFNFGGSGTLQRQIEQGAPVDLFLSASEQYVDALVQKDKITQESAAPFLKNVLVVIAPKNSDKKNLKALVDEGEKIAIATPKAAPAGDYAKEALTHLKMWQSVKGKLVYGKDVRHVLTLVEEQSVAGGIVYQSDALITDKVKIVEKIDPTVYSPIIYGAGIVANTKEKREAQEFLSFLKGPKAQKIFIKYGFVSP